MTFYVNQPEATDVEPATVEGGGAGPIAAHQAVHFLGQRVEVYNGATKRWHKGVLEAIVADMGAVAVVLRPQLRLRVSGAGREGFRDVPMAWVTAIRIDRS